MADYSNIKRGISKIENLERELNLKQLQINRLLNITQAINNNVSAEGLFNMYHSFLSWEVAVKKMALFVRENEEWNCATFIGIPDDLLQIDISDHLSQYTRLHNLENTDHPLIREFDVVIPVRHKEDPIAYVFIGGFGEDDDMYNKVQFITTITNIIAVAIENKRLFKQQLEQERLKREMELASEMQRTLIPKQLPKKDCYHFSSIYQPHLGVGGDYFDFLEFADGQIAFCIGDISGKGVAAALLMANFQANFHTLIRQRRPLDELVEALNDSTFRTTGGERFITFFVGEFDRDTRKLRFVNAGHNPPLLLHGNQVEHLKKGCTILGSFPKLPKIEIGERVLDEEAMILTYTDGLTDLTNNAGAYFTEEMLADFTVSNRHLLPDDFNRALWEQLESFRGKQQYPDDFTVLTCKIFMQSTGSN